MFNAISRRDFMKGMMVGGVALGSAGILAACGSSSSSTSSSSSEESSSTESSSESSSSTESSSSESTETTETVAGMEGWTAFENTVTLQIPVYDRGSSSNGVADVVDNYWTNWIQENFGDVYNIDVQFVAITRSDVMTDYGLLAASQSLPTILMEYDYDKLATWQSEGYSAPYDIEEFKTIAPTYYQMMVDEGIDSYTQLADEDYLMLGKRPYGNTNYTFVTFYRKDWLEEAGYTEYPSTASELNDLYAKLVENGHSAPLGGTKVSGAGIDQNYAYRDYPQDEETWVTTGDYQIPALSTEAQKRFLKLENYHYNQGWTNQEYYMRDSSEAQSDFINGLCFTYSCYTSSTITVLESFYETNPDAELGVCVCSSEFIEDKTWGSNNSYRPTNVFGTMISRSTTATDDEFKAAEMYMEWMCQEDVLFTMQWGIEDINFEYVDGTPTVISSDDSRYDESYAQGHNNNVDYWMIVTASKTLGNIEDDVAAITPQGVPQDFYQEILDNYYGQNQLYNDGYANSDALFAASLDSVSEYSQTLYDLYTEYRDLLVMCDPDEFDTLYDEYSEKYLQAGYQAVIDERLELYNEGLTTKLPTA
ncbi:MAG: substrate-binding domain-containing protein [Lachnospiraceae bacterium]|nr:substrate-binding domain-containing protein [Lachnospiraceae bacterium]